MYSDLQIFIKFQNRTIISNGNVPSARQQVHKGFHRCYFLYRGFTPLQHMCKGC